MSLLSFCHYYMKYIFHCDDKLPTFHLIPHLILIPSPFRTRDSSNDSTNWCKHDIFWEKGIWENYFYMFFTRHINFPSCTQHRKEFSLFLACRRQWWLSESLKACALSAQLEVEILIIFHLYCYCLSILFSASIS